MKHQITHCLTDAVIFESELPLDTPATSVIRLLLQQIINMDTKKDSINLRYANLSSANLSDINLAGADLRGACLRYSNLNGATLSRVDLSDAELSDASFRDADLFFANMSNANLRRADFSNAFLKGANMTNAIMRRSILTGVDLSTTILIGAELATADLSIEKNDFFQIMLRSTHEVPGLRTALVEGKVDGSSYEGECACLVGTIAKVRGSGSYAELGNGITPNSQRPAERWFLGISKGDTPETSMISRITVEWIDEFVGLLTAARML